MTRTLHRLAQNRSGAAAAELAMVLPILLLIMFGSLELGNFFMNEHTLVKAVRNGARYAARQPFADYPDCSSVDPAMRDRTREVVRKGYLSGGSIITPNIQASDIAVTTSCATTAGGQTMTGIYFSRANGAQIVTVNASVNYLSVVGILGFNGPTITLNARSQAAVAGT